MTEVAAGSAAPAPAHGIPFAEAVRVWLRVAALSFGGPAGQIAVMHRILVDEKRWIGEARFLHALNFCMLLPGPEAQQLAIYIGWLLHRTWGGVVAGVLFVLPGFLAILGLSLVYVAHREAPLLEGVFFGLKAAVVAIVVQAVIRIGGRTLRSRASIAVAAAAFVAIFAFGVPFPLIVLAAGLSGWLASRLGSEAFRPGGHGNGRPGLRDEDSALGVEVPEHALGQSTLGPAAVCLGLWLAPVAAAGAGARAGRGVRPARGLLQPDGGRHLRRRLRGARLRGAGGGGLRLGDGRRDARRARNGRDHAGAADHGRAVRRLSRGLPRPGRARSMARGACWRRCW